ncbi:MAG: hypothetical protein IPO32_03415 [Crocinitomicaceae bacterium]|jgi:hypothetical protein|nr:hypothetical protein [Crocinitomicaceae bacterium]
MTIKERLRNPFVQQYLLEILLPIVGYYFFDWSLIIIASFYLIDQIGSEYSFVRKFQAIRKSENKSGFRYSLMAIIFFLMIVCVEIFALYYFFRDENVEVEQKMITELAVFAKEELWIILPLIILTYHLKDQFTFFMPRRYLQKESKKFVQGQLIELSLIAGLVVVGSVVFSNFVIRDQILLFSFLAVKLLFDFTIGKYIEKRSTR